MTFMVLSGSVKKALGSQLYCIHINNGLMRKGESDAVVATFRDAFHIRLDYVDATKRFLAGLRGVADPERKRKIIGRLFIEVFQDGRFPGPWDG